MFGELRKQKLKTQFLAVGAESYVLTDFRLKRENS